MKKSYDFKKEWPKLKKQFMDMSQEALALAKKGEKELIRISKKSKLHMDSTALVLKKEHLLHLIGKEYVKAKCPGPRTPKLQKLLTELKGLEKQARSLNRQIKGKKGKRK